ncbi:protein SPMIP1-like [Carettochelys insculpta]|uniref:protein SPMIP1 n=1 Tax=Carettochelys insculpta TaxID=44489 RepID=UPI003EB7DBFD
MARQLSMDTREQDFWKEAFLKELLLRVRWRQRYGGPIKARQEQLRPRRQAAEQPLKLPALPPAPGPQPQKPPEEPAGPAASLPATEMKPVAPKVQQLLYQGISHDGEGRQRYLQRRARSPPEAKYYSPVTTNFLYGWRLGDVTRGYAPPAPKCRIESFFRKNGAFSLLDPRDVAV